MDLGGWSREIAMRYAHPADHLRTAACRVDGAKLSQHVPREAASGM
jgi:hypothetical protein